MRRCGATRLIDMAATTAPSSMAKTRAVAVNLSVTSVASKAAIAVVTRSMSTPGEPKASAKAVS